MQFVPTPSAFDLSYEQRFVNRRKNTFILRLNCSSNDCSHRRRQGPIVILCFEGRYP